MTTAAEKETDPKQKPAQDKAPEASRTKDAAAQEEKEEEEQQPETEKKHQPEKEGIEEPTEQQEEPENEETDPHRGTARTLSQHKGLDPEAARNNDTEEYDEDGVEQEKQKEPDSPGQKED